MSRRDTGQLAGGSRLNDDSGILLPDIRQIVFDLFDLAA